MTDSLLPYNATSQERSLEGATARAADVPVMVRQSWNPDTCPAALLPWLAWALSIDEWSAAWPEAVKRAVIRDSYQVHKKKGTVLSVRQVFASLGFGNVLINEGKNRRKYDGSIQYDGFPNYGDSSGWPWYRVQFDKLLSTAQANQAGAMLATIAPVRSRLYSLDFTGAALIYSGAAKYDGTYTHGEA